MDSFNPAQLPFEIRSKLAELDLELSEGDITEKGYQKKRSRLLAQFSESQASNTQTQVSSINSVSNVDTNVSGQSDGKSNGHSHKNSSIASQNSTSNETSKYDYGDMTKSPSHKFSKSKFNNAKHNFVKMRLATNIREEAVQEALSRNRHQYQDALIPSRRTESIRYSINQSDSYVNDDDSDDAVESSRHQSPVVRSAASAFHNNASPSPINPAVAPPRPPVDSYDLVAGDTMTTTNEDQTVDVSNNRQHQAAINGHNHHHKQVNRHPNSPEGDQLNVPSSPSVSSHSFQSTSGDLTKSPAPCGGISVLPRFPVSSSAVASNNPPATPVGSGSTTTNPPHPGQQPEQSQPVDNSSPTPLPSDRLTQLPPVAPSNNDNVSRKESIQSNLVVCPSKVSEKIQQLVNTLMRPKRRPLTEYFLDEDDHVLVRPVLDPSAPRPTGPQSIALTGGELTIPSGMPRNLESALQRHAGLSSKSIAATCLDPSLKSEQTLTYYKLRKDISCQSMGFLIGSLDVRIVLTSDQCYKALPRTPNNEIVTFSQWPRVTWINTDLHAGKGSGSVGSNPPKDWVEPDRLGAEETMYIEYAFAKEGNVHGVTVSRRAAVSHCLALTSACRYSDADVMVCVVDHRRETGLWHAVLASVFNGIHVIFVPYSVMQVDPGCWLRAVTKYRASIALVKSRDMHWALLAERDHHISNLSSLRALIVADGSNPWSLNSCDSFIEKFKSRGLIPSVICPSAGSSETLTLSLRRPPPIPSPSAAASKVKTPTAPPAEQPTGVRGVISIHSLTYGVVRMDSEESLTSLVLQDCGQVLPLASAVVVRLGPDPIICQADELGEICLAADSTGSGYWELPGPSSSRFRVEPLNLDGTPLYSASGPRLYVRSGYLGFSSPSSPSGGVLFVCGSLDGMMTVEGRRHNADDLVATALAVQPTNLIYRGRIAVFSIDLLKDERVIIVAELRQGFSDDAVFPWMSMVLQAIDGIHQVNVYCIALVHQHTLPRTPFGGVNRHAVKRLFDDGKLHPAAILLCPHSSIHNLPQPRQQLPSQVGPSAIMVGQVVQGARLAEARGRPLTRQSESSNHVQNLAEALSKQATTDPEHRLFTVYNAKRQEAATLTSGQLLKRAERLACWLRDKGKVTVGSPVVLLYPPGIDQLCAFYACLILGAIPVPLRPPRPDSSPSMTSPSSPRSHLHSSSTLTSPTNPTGFGSLIGGGAGGSSGTNTSHGSSGGSSSNVCTTRLPMSPSMQASLELIASVCQYTRASVIMTQGHIVKLLKSKEATAWAPYNSWPTILDSDECSHKKKIHPPPICKSQPIAYLDFAASTTGTLTGIPVTHQVVDSLCRVQRKQCEFFPTREVVLSLDPYTGLGFTLWALTSVYCGHHSILIPPSVTEQVPDLWLSVCSQRKVRDVFCSNFTLELTVRHLGASIASLKRREVSLSGLRSLVVVGEERPRVKLISSFIRICLSLGLSSRAVSTSFGCRVNLAISLQGANSPESTTVYVDRIGLKNDRIKMLEKGSPNSLCLMESGKLLPGIHVVIANPDTLGQCSDSQLGEIWVSSPHNSSRLLGPYPNTSHSSSISLSGGDPTPLPLNEKQEGPNPTLNARLVTGDKNREYARTGFLGFVRRTQLSQSEDELHDAIFVVGSLEETILLRGMRFHPVDIENTVMQSHRKICECAVFTWSNLLVVVTELSGPENEAMDLVHSITAKVLSEHQLIVGVIVVTDPGTLPVNSGGEKQRILLRDSFVNDKLDPIYVSYNI